MCKEFRVTDPCNYLCLIQEIYMLSLIYIIFHINYIYYFNNLHFDSVVY